MPSSGTSTPLSPHVRRKRRQRRAAILTAALEAFRQRGYHATTLDDIAGRVGVGKTALYHYFPDKEAILFACHRQALTHLARHLATARERHARAADRLRDVVTQHVTIVTGSANGSPLAVEVPALSAERQARLVAARDRYERGLRDVVADGIAAGEFRAVDPKIVVFAILGSINWIARWYRPAGSLPPEALARAFADYLVGGLTCQAP